MEKKSSKIISDENGGGEKCAAYVPTKLRRFISAYDKLTDALRRRFDTEGDVIGTYVGRLGSVSNLAYRDELMIRLVRYREIRNKFTRGELSQAEFTVSEEDIASLLSLAKRVSCAKDPVSCHDRGVIVSRIKHYSKWVAHVIFAALIFILSVALFFAIKY